jgi:hypothetical protein
MQWGIEGAIKLALVTLLVLAGLAVWLLPRTRIVTSRTVGGTLFVATSVVGIVCSAAGLLVLLIWPQRVLEWHLWELAAMPLVLLYAYWLVVMRRARTGQVLDEKQDLDMTRAGALTWGISIPAMCLAFVLPDARLFEGGLWFPWYLFVTLMVYSATTLYYFRR